MQYKIHDKNFQRLYNIMQTYGATIQSVVLFSYNVQYERADVAYLQIQSQLKRELQYGTQGT